jgi:spore coat protein Y
MIDSRKEMRNLCILEALKTIKSHQDFKKDPLLSSSYKYLKMKDTIPVILWKDSGLFELTGYISDHLEDKKSDSFCTSFFRIENIDEKQKCATLSLLKPLDIDGCLSKEICEMVRLERTPICVEVDLSCFCAVHFLNDELLNRKIMIEPR